MQGNFGIDFHCGCEVCWPSKRLLQSLQCLSCIFRTVQSAQGWLDFDLLNMSRADLIDSLTYLWPSLLLHADIFSLNLFCRRQKAKEKALRKMKKLMAKSGPALSDKITRWSESVLCDPAFDNTLVRLTQDNRKNSAGCLGETSYNIYHSLNLCFAQQQTHTIWLVVSPDRSVLESPTCTSIALPLPYVRFLLPRKSSSTG